MIILHSNLPDPSHENTGPAFEGELLGEGFSLPSFAWFVPIFIGGKLILGFFQLDSVLIIEKVENWWNTNKNDLKVQNIEEGSSGKKIFQRLSNNKNVIPLARGNTSDYSEDGNWRGSRVYGMMELIHSLLWNKLGQILRRRILWCYKTLMDIKPSKCACQIMHLHQITYITWQLKGFHKITFHKISKWITNSSIF